ncbi:hypothetical protein Tco_0157087 [Tanacetum coccineum]
MFQNPPPFLSTPRLKALNSKALRFLEDVPEADVPPQKRLYLTALAPRITNVWDDMVGDMEETSPTTLEVVNQRLADLTTTLAQDTHATYVRFEDARDD